MGEPPFIQFKKAEIQDIAAILKMMEAFNAIDGYPFDASIREKNLLEFISNRGLGEINLIYKDQQMAGYIILTFGYSFEYNGRDAFIDEFFLKQAYRNQGIGKKSLDLIGKRAEQLGVNAIHLEVEKDNRVASTLYTNKGYKGNKRNLLTRSIDQ